MFMQIKFYSLFYYGSLPEAVSSTLVNNKIGFMKLLFGFLTIHSFENAIVSI